MPTRLPAGFGGDEPFGALGRWDAGKGRAARSPGDGVARFPCGTRKVLVTEGLFIEFTLASLALTFALVDARSGEVLWFNRESFDNQDPRSSTVLDHTVNVTLGDLPSDDPP